MQNALQWLLQSSADPEKVSLTVKGLLVGAIPVVMIGLGLAHINVGEADLTSLVDGIVTFIQAGLLIISAVATIFGFARKIWLTVTGHQM